MTDTVPAWGGELDPPERLLRLDVNALNYCAYDMALRDADELSGWLAVPNTLESAWIDVYALPERKRVAEAVGRQGVLGRGLERPPIVMGLRLAFEDGVLRLVAGYEDGSVQAWVLSETSTGLHAELSWSHRPHTESVMALTLTPAHDRVVSVDADARLAQCVLAESTQPEVWTLPRPGNASVAMRDDARVLAVGGWDGAVRVFSRDAQLLATLVYHKEGVSAVAYIRQGRVHMLAVPEADSDEELAHPVPRHLLVAGAKDGRVSLWDVPFTRDDVMPRLRAP